MSLVEFLGVASLSALFALIFQPVVLGIRLRSLKLKEDAYKGIDDGTRIQNTLRLLDEYHSQEYILARSKAWSVHQSVMKKEGKDRAEQFRILVQYLDGKLPEDDASALSIEFPFDKKFPTGPSYFQCVARVVSFWEKFRLLLELRIVHKDLTWPLRAEYRDWNPLFDELVKEANSYYAESELRPSWVRHIESLNVEWLVM